MNRRKMKKLCRQEKTTGCSGTTVKDVNYATDSRTECVNSSVKVPHSKRFPLSFAEKKRERERE